MAAQNRVRAQRILREAEGYLELGLGLQALAALERLTDPGTFLGHVLYVKGEALRSLDRWAEAADVLEQAAEHIPSNISMWLALGWCQKRAGHLDTAIVALERAREVDPEQAIIHYNLACYLSLAGRKPDALNCLSRALELKPEVRDMIGDESDFDPLRADPDFQALTSIIV